MTQPRSIYQSQRPTISFRRTNLMESSKLRLNWVHPFSPPIQRPQLPFYVRNRRAFLERVQGWALLLLPFLSRGLLSFGNTKTPLLLIISFLVSVCHSHLHFLTLSIDGRLF